MPTLLQITALSDDRGWKLAKHKRSEVVLRGVERVRKVKEMSIRDDLIFADSKAGQDVAAGCGVSVVIEQELYSG